MTFTPPSGEELAAIAERYGLGLDSQDIEWYRQLIAGAMTSYGVVERLYKARLTEPPASSIMASSAETESASLSTSTPSQSKITSSGVTAGSSGLQSLPAR